MSKVLMFGNGINRCFNGKSWKEIINDISSKTSFRTDDNFLNTLTFDCQEIEAIKRNINSLLSDVVNQTKLENKMLMDCSELYKQFTSKNIDAILTTNYGYEIESSLFSEFDSNNINSISTDNRETVTSYKRANKINGKLIYHIHGEQRFEKSICIGLQHYIDNISFIKKKMDKIYSLGNKENYKEELKLALTGSWVEHIFFSDLEIIGLSLDKSEIDLWWLFAMRASLIAQNEINANKIIYHYCGVDNIDPSLRNYLSKLNIEVDDHAVINDNWVKAYEAIASKL